MVGRQADKVILFPSKRGSKCGKTDKKGETDVEDLTPFRRRFLSLGYIKGLMYPIFHKSFGYDYGAVYKKREKRTEYRADRHTVSSALQTFNLSDSNAHRHYNLDAG